MEVQVTPKVLAVFVAIAFVSTDLEAGNKKLDTKLRQLLTEQGVGSLDAGPAQDPDEVALGQALFFDWELSGNRDTACATCHHPTLGTADQLSLSVGTAPVDLGQLGPDRELGPGRELMPRNAPDVFNRGSSAWFSQFWDSRVVSTGTGFISPAGAALPDGLPNVLAVQAMFPVTSRDEMRGAVGDLDSFGEVNELALIDDADLPGQWAAIMQRLLALPGYQQLFADAFPDVAVDDLDFGHAARALAAFEIDAYTFLDSPWDRYVAGDNNALSSGQKRGALLFYGSANCSTCHSGSLMTDQQHYNLGVPQLGPGKGAEAPEDHGRGRETGIPEDRYRFRTPALRNCEETFPYMHNGAYDDLEDVVRHHAHPLFSLITYEPEDFMEQEEVIETYTIQNQFGVVFGIDNVGVPHLNDKKVKRLVKFLEALTAPQLRQRLEATIPDSTPSGLLD